MELQNLTLKTAPTTLPVSLADLKAHLVIEVPDADARLNLLLLTAIARFDGEGGILARSLCPQTWTFALGDWPEAYGGEGVPLPYPPVASISSIKYYDASNAQQTLDASNYLTLRRGQLWFLHTASGASLPSVYDRPDAITVEYVAGYANAAAVPGPIKQAILLQAAELFGFRGDGEDNETAGADAAIERLIAPYKVRTWR